MWDKGASVARVKTLKRYPSDLTDVGWEAIAPLLLQSSRTTTNG
jgi:hypothetical protein